MGEVRSPHREVCICADCESLREYHKLFDAVQRDASANMFGLGAFRFQKKLTNGTVVTVSLKNPARAGHLASTDGAK